MNMSLNLSPKLHLFPVAIISQAVQLYCRFNHSLGEMSEKLAYHSAWFMIKELERILSNMGSGRNGD